MGESSAKLYRSCYADLHPNAVYSQDYFQVKLDDSLPFAIKLWPLLTAIDVSLKEKLVLAKFACHQYFLVSVYSSCDFSGSSCV